jgi:Protein of unknown function (DUF3455)
MYSTKINRLVRLVVLLTIAALALHTISVARASDNTNGPELPAQCDSLQVSTGNKVAFHVYARGVQIYTWDGSTWSFKAPVATLFAEANYFGEVGIHYVGPTWESKSGSKVFGVRVPGTGCAPDQSAIPWLLLKGTPIGGAGIFSSVTYIQRVNTTGGTAPTTDGSVAGEMMEVPYTAEYYFYRAQD